MFVIEVLLVGERPLFVLRAIQGQPLVSTFELSEVQQKIADAADDFVEKSKTMKATKSE